MYEAIETFIIENPWMTFIIIVVVWSLVNSTIEKFKPCDDEDLYVKLNDLRFQLNGANNTILQRGQELSIARDQILTLQDTLSKCYSQQANEHHRQEHSNSTKQSSFGYEDLKEAMDRMNGVQFGGPNFAFGSSTPKANTLKDIKAKYRKEVKENHPDLVRARGGTEEEIAQATAKVQVLNAQYEKDKERYK